MTNDTRKVTFAEFVKETIMGAGKVGEVAVGVVKAGVSVVACALIEYNPLKLSTGDVLRIRTDTHKDNHFVVDAINVTERKILNKRYVFVDYHLVDRSVGKDGLWLMLRVIPRDKNDQTIETANAFLLTKQIEEEYAESIYKLLEDGVLPVEDTGGLVYKRQEDIRGAYIGTVTEHTAQEGKKVSKLKYWDFVAQTESGVTSLFVVEMSEDTHYFEGYSGEEVDLKVIDALRTS